MRLNQPLNRKLNARLTVRPDGRRCRRPDYLAAACTALNQFLRQAKKLTQADPHLFGPPAARYFQDSLRAAQREAETEAALRQVYGPSPPGAPPRPPGVWTQRYTLDPKWKGFRKWFAKTYGS